MHIDIRASMNMDSICWDILELMIVGCIIRRPYENRENLFDQRRKVGRQAQGIPMFSSMALQYAGDDAAHKGSGESIVVWKWWSRKIKITQAL